MLIHTHSMLSSIFHKLLHKDHFEGTLKKLNPTCLEGIAGIGKIYYIKEFIRDCLCSEYNPFLNTREDYTQDCSCKVCNSISNNTLVDMFVLDNKEDIEAIRGYLEVFVYSYPKEYNYKFLIVPDLHLISNRKTDILLKIFEESPKYLKIFATCLNANKAPQTLMSRLNIIHCNPLSKDNLRFILSLSSTTENQLSNLDKYNFKSLDQVMVYSKYRFEDKFKSIFVERANAYTITKEVKYLLDILDSEDQLGEALLFFMEYYLDKIYEFCDLNKDTIKVQYFKQHIQEKVIPKFAKCFFGYLDSPKQYRISKSNQLFLFLNLINIARLTIEG